MKRIAFRTIGGENTGYGHLYRCLSLAKAIMTEPFESEIFFIVNEEITNIVTSNGFDAIVSNHFEDDYEIIENKNVNLTIFDSYNANDSYLRKIRHLTKLMIFDDNNDIYDSRIPNILLNGNIHAKDLKYHVDSSTFFMLGPEYLVMKEDYWTKTSIESVKKRGVMITTGGSDSYNISPAILKELVKTEYSLKVIVGPGYSALTIKELNKLRNNNTSLILQPKSLKDYIKKSQYVVTASGSTVYEVLSQKTIPIIFSIAENQNVAYKYFNKLGIQTIGRYPDIRYDEITRRLELSGKMNYNQLYDNIDGKGALRVAHQILECLLVE